MNHESIATALRNGLMIRNKMHEYQRLREMGDDLDTCAFDKKAEELYHEIIDLEKTMRTELESLERQTLARKGAPSCKV